MANEKKKGLGRGLGALLGGSPMSSPAPTPSAAPAEPAALSDGTRLIELDPSEIKPNPKQPRLVFDEAALEELAQSLKRDGVQEPVIVRPAADGGYELISGERRVRASIMADLTVIPAVVRDVPDADLLRLGLIENIQREDLNPIETAKAYQLLMEETGWTQDQLAREVGKRRTSVTNALRLLALPEVVQEHVSVGTLSAGHAKVIASLGTEAAQERLAERIVSQGLSVREAEELAAHLAKPKSHTKPDGSARPKKDANIAQLEDELRRRFGRKAAIKAGEDGRGTVELAFFSWSDLDVLIEQLRGGK